MSFQAAMLRLGGKVIGFDNPGNSSVSKGESLKDTVRIISNYSDLIVMRNPRERVAGGVALFACSRDQRGRRRAFTSNADADGSCNVIL